MPIFDALLQSGIPDLLPRISASRDQQAGAGPYG